MMIGKKYCKMTGCDKKGPYSGETGLRMHQIRAHSNAGKAWGSPKPKQTKSKHSKYGHGEVKLLACQVLETSDIPMHIQEIARQMQQLGYQPNISLKSAVANITGAVSKDTNITRTSRGYYALKKKPNIPLHQPSKPAPAAEKGLQAMALPKEALILRIEQLETELEKRENEYNVLCSAHITLLRK